MDGTFLENGDLCNNNYPGEISGSNYNIDLRGKQYLIAGNYWPLPLQSGVDQCVITPPPVVPTRLPTQAPAAVFTAPSSPPTAAPTSVLFIIILVLSAALGVPVAGVVGVGFYRVRYVYIE